MKPSYFDLICLGGSLLLAICYFLATGDLSFADRLGLSFMLSWVVLQSLRFILGLWHLPDHGER